MINPNQKLVFALPAVCTFARRGQRGSSQNLADASFPAIARAVWLPYPTQLVRYSQSSRFPPPGSLLPIASFVPGASSSGQAADRERVGRWLQVVFNGRSESWQSVCVVAKKVYSGSCKKSDRSAKPNRRGSAYGLISGFGSRAMAAEPSSAWRDMETRGPFALALSPQHVALGNVAQFVNVKVPR
jgi:hypothetical protein